jgi:integrase
VKTGGGDHTCPALANSRWVGNEEQEESQTGSPEEHERFTVSPHVLRHTFLRKLAEEKGVQYAKEASGHKSDRYIWRYVKPNQESLAAAVDELDSALSHMNLR